MPILEVKNVSKIYTTRFGSARVQALSNRLAVTYLKNNRQFYLPYILTGMVSAMMFYIMRAIQGSRGIASMRGVGTVSIILTMGLVIVALCRFWRMKYSTIWR
jgi:hypothetical protein